MKHSYLKWRGPETPQITRVSDSYGSHFLAVRSVSCVQLFGPCGLQHASLPVLHCLLELCSDSCPLRWRCYLAISSSAAPVLHCLLEFCSDSCPLRWRCYLAISSPAAPSPVPSVFVSIRIFTKSRLSASGGPSIGASASVLSVDIQG